MTATLDYYKPGTVLFNISLDMHGNVFKLDQCHIHIVLGSTVVRIEDLDLTSPNVFKSNDIVIYDPSNKSFCQSKTATNDFTSTSFR